LKREFDLDVQWRGVEIHPETPQEGTPMAARFPGADISRMMAHLRAMGAPFGITFVDRPLLSNSRRALQAAEFARDQGTFSEFHQALFAAYFSHGLDIGSLEVLTQLAADCGLDPAALERAVQAGAYRSRLEQAQEEATRLGVTGVPTFFVNEKKRIIGSQPLDVFRRALVSR
jgi:predicted DsbA family dithiol-disulfide isomerase